MTPKTAGMQAGHLPFPHASVPALLTAGDADAVLAWLASDAPWRLRVESFYEQYEFSLLDATPPGDLAALTGTGFVDAMRDLLVHGVGAPADLDLVDVSAHKLVAGQTIRVHNDFIDGQETHRVLLQLNHGWSVDNGGLLMLFADDQPESVTTAILPSHGSAFAFEISARSYHAVSTIHAGERYTLVYTFRAA